MNTGTIQVTAQMHDHVMTLTGTPARVLFWNAKVATEDCAQVAEYYDLDFFGTAMDIYNYEIEAMGGKMIYSDNAMPTIDFREPLINEPGDLLRLRTPNFLKDARLPYAMDCMKLSGDYPRGRKVAFMCGTFSMAVGLRSYPKLIRDMRRDPSFVRDLMTFIIDEVHVPYAKAVKGYVGVNNITLADAWANIPNLTVGQINEWVVPVAQRLREKGAQVGISFMSGGADYCEERPEKFDPKILHECFKAQIAIKGMPMIVLGLGPWHKLPLDPVIDFLNEYRGRGIIPTVGATVNARLLRDGPVSEIVDSVKRLVDAFARDYPLLISLANIPADAPSDHVHAAVAAVHTYGKKPIVPDLNAIEFTPPKRESFQEWRKNRKLSA